MLWLVGISLVTEGGMIVQFLADDETSAPERLAPEFLADTLGVPTATCRSSRGTASQPSAPYCARRLLAAPFLTRWRACGT